VAEGLELSRDSFREFQNRGSCRRSLLSLRGEQTQCSNFGASVGQSHQVMQAPKSYRGADHSKSLSALTRQSN
jgi:hypothetical protein